MNSNIGPERKDVANKVNSSAGVVTQGELFGECKLHDITDDFPKVPRCKRLVNGIKCQMCINLLPNQKAEGTS